MDCNVIGTYGYGYRQLEQETVLNLFYRLHPSFEGQGYAREAITTITSSVDYIDQEIVEAIRANRCSRRSINLAERSRFKRGGTMNDITNREDVVFYKRNTMTLSKR